MCYTYTVFLHYLHSVTPNKENYTVVHRYESTLTCTIQGIDADWIPSIIWEKRQTDKPTERENVRGSKEEFLPLNKILKSSLTIKCATEADAGVYNCIVQKKTGSLRSVDMHLTVLRSKRYITDMSLYESPATIIIKFYTCVLSK